MRILAIRLDRLGDVLMSLPAIDFLRSSVPEVELFVAIRPEVASAIRPYLKSWNIKEWPLRDGRLDWTLERPDAALILNAPAQVYRDLFIKRVNVRYGMYSSLPSFVLLTHGRRQRRSRADRSEALYNAQLTESFLRTLGRRVDFAGDFTPLSIPVDESEAEEAAHVVSGLEVGEKYLVAHPGMGGSALNLSVDGYVRLLSALQKRYPLPVILSRGPAVADIELVDRLSRALPDARTIPSVSLGVLREIFRKATAVVAPSTGPLHLAHYVGATTVGVYSPVQSHRPLRWQPWGGEGRSLVLTPEVDCPGLRECIGRSCPQYLCMEKAPWELLLDKAGDFIGSNRQNQT